MRSYHILSVGVEGTHGQSGRLGTTGKGKGKDGIISGVLDDCARVRRLLRLFFYHWVDEESLVVSYQYNE
jgi:hypothetical protein